MTRFNLLLVVLLAGGNALGGEPQAVVDLSAPTGDAPEHDLTKVVLSSDGRDVKIEATFAKDVNAELKASGTPSHVFEMLIDTDNNAKTGGNADWIKVNGIEATGRIAACIQYKGGASCAGVLGGMPVTGYFASLDLNTIKPGTFDKDKEIRDSLDASGKEVCAIKGSSINVRIPYADLGLKSGQVVRFAILESHAGDKVLQPDALLKLQ